MKIELPDWLDEDQTLTLLCGQELVAIKHPGKDWKIKDLLIGILLGILATLLCLGLIWCKQLDAGKQDKHKIIEVVL